MDELLSFNNSWEQLPDNNDLLKTACPAHHRFQHGTFHLEMEMDEWLGYLLALND